MKKLLGIFGFGSQVRPISLEEIPRYPPFIAGLPAVDLELVLESQKELIVWIKNNLALGDHDYQKYVHKVILRYAGFVHFLPASENHHHRGAGGLFRHGLEVARFMLEEIHGIDPYATPLNTDPPQKKAKDKFYWRLSNFYAGLLHDIGKPLTDVRVTDKDGRYQWRPREISLADWLISNGLDRYYLHWQKDRHKLHETLGPSLLDQILGKDIAGTFAHEANLTFNDLIRSVSKMDDDTDMVLRVIKCDQRSTGLDLEKNNYNPDTHGSAVPVFSYIKDIIREHIEVSDWKVNTKGHPVWFCEDGLFIAWKKATEDIRYKAKTMGIKGFPHSHLSLAEIMVSRGAAEKPLVGSDDSLLWNISPDILTRSDGKRITFWALKISKPELLVDLELLPDYTSIIIPGVNDNKTDEVHFEINSHHKPQDRRNDVAQCFNDLAYSEVDNTVALDKRESDLSSIVAGFDMPEQPTRSAISEFTNFNISELQGSSENDMFATEGVTQQVVDNPSILSSEPDPESMNFSVETPIDSPQGIDLTNLLPNESHTYMPKQPQDFGPLFSSISNEPVKEFLQCLITNHVPTRKISDQWVIPYGLPFTQAISGGSYSQELVFDALDKLLDDRVLQTVPGKPRSVVFQDSGIEFVKINRRFMYDAERVLALLAGGHNDKEPKQIQEQETQEKTVPRFDVFIDSHQLEEEPVCGLPAVQKNKETHSNGGVKNTPFSNIPPDDIDQPTVERVLLKREVSSPSISNDFFVINERQKTQEEKSIPIHPIQQSLIPEAEVEPKVIIDMVAMFADELIQNQSNFSVEKADEHQPNDIQDSAFKELHVENNVPISETPTHQLSGETKLDKVYDLISKFLADSGKIIVSNDYLIIDIDDLEEYGISKGFDGIGVTLIYLSGLFIKKPKKTGTDTILVKNLQKGTGIYFSIPGVV